MALWKLPPLKEISIGGFRGLDESVPPTARPLGTLSSMSNLVLSPNPSLSTVPGLTALSTPIAAAVGRGVTQYKNLAGTTTQTLAQAGTQLSYTTGTTWTSISAAMPNKNFTGANLNDYVCLFWSGSAPQKWSGAALTALGGSPPQGEFAIEAYNRIFVAGIPTREGDVDYCSPLLPETWTPAATNTAGSNTVSTNAVKWLGFDRVQGKVVIWTTQELLVFNGPETPNLPDLWAVRTVSPYGTPNGRTVQNLNGTWVWLTNNADKIGFAMWSGGSVDVTYLPISTSLGLIDWSNIANACSWQDELGRYHCQTPKTSGYQEFIYDPVVNEWFMGSSKDARASGILTVSGVNYHLLVNEVGQAYKATGTTNGGAAISWSLVVGPTMLGDTWHGKEIREVQLVLSAAAGATVNAAVALNESGDYGTTRTISASTVLTRTRVAVPVSMTDTAFGDVVRLKVWGTGVVTIHDAYMKVYQRGS